MSRYALALLAFLTRMPVASSQTVLCTDNCVQNHFFVRHNNGYCDDGGEGSRTSACALGQDCTDCGPRIQAGPPVVAGPPAPPPPPSPTSPIGIPSPPPSTSPSPPPSASPSPPPSTSPSPPPSSPPPSPPQPAPPPGPGGILRLTGESPKISFGPEDDPTCIIQLIPGTGRLNSTCKINAPNPGRRRLDKLTARLTKLHFDEKDQLLSAPYELAIEKMVRTRLNAWLITMDPIEATTFHLDFKARREEFRADAVKNLALMQAMQAAEDGKPPSKKAKTAD